MQYSITFEKPDAVYNNVFYTIKVCITMRFVGSR